MESSGDCPYYYTLVLDTSALLGDGDMVRLLKREVTPGECTPRNRVVIPTNVFKELYGLAVMHNPFFHGGFGPGSGEGGGQSEARSAKDAMHENAHAVYSFLIEECGFPASGEMRRSGKSGGSPAYAGRVVLQRPEKETVDAINRYARNSDTRIVSCAVYFAHEGRKQVQREAEAADPRRKRQRNEGHHGNYSVSAEVAVSLRAAEGKHEGAYLTSYDERALLKQCRTVLLSNDSVMRIKARPYNLPAMTLDSWKVTRNFV